MKNKIKIFLFALLFLLSACGKTEDLTLKSGVYTLKNNQEDILGDFTITVNDDGTYEWYESPLSSYIGSGHYSIEGDMVTFKDDGDGCSNEIRYYRIKNDKLLFISEGSKNYSFVPLDDGAVFEWTGSGE